MAADPMTTALVVGGGGATGRAIVDELLARGAEVTILNRGRHNDGLAPGLELLRGDPHVAEGVRDALGRRSWDVGVVTYGRVRILAHELAGRVGRLVTVSGMPVVATRVGQPVREGDALVTAATEPAGLRRIATRIAVAEEAVLEASRSGAYAGTVVRYPYVYGPHAVVPMEWQVVKRCLDGRRRWVVRAGGLAMTGRCASPNAAALVARVLDRPEVAAGRVYHAADDRQLSQREWVETLAAVVGVELEIVDVPLALAPPAMSCAPLAGEDLFVLSEADLLAGRLRHHVPTAERARTELGYVQRVEPADWMARTVEHQLAHPPATDGSHPACGPADFDYAAEDALLAWWDAVVAAAPRFGAPVTRRHAYEHPRPGVRPSSPT